MKKWKAHSDSGPKETNVGKNDNKQSVLIESVLKRKILQPCNKYCSEIFKEKKKRKEQKK